MNNSIIVNTDTINNFSKDIEMHSESMEAILDQMILLSNDIDKFYNTPTGKMMKDNLMEYLYNSKNACKSLKTMGVVLDKSSKLYDATNQQIAHEVGR